MAVPFIRSVDMRVAKTVRNVPAEDKKNEETKQSAAPLVPVNAVCWNKCPQFNQQFITADDSSRLALYDGKDPKNNTKLEVSNGLLTCLSIEPREGRLVATGGIDCKVHVF